MTLLTVDHLEVVYQRAITAVQGVSLQVAPQQIVALIGTNGAGKTTTLRAISGFLGIDDARVTEGTIAFRGERIENRLPHENTARGIVLVPERDKLFPNLTVAENLAAPAPGGSAWSHFLRKAGARPGSGPGQTSSGNRSRVSPTERRRREALIYEFFPRLAELRSRTGGLLSGGERQMLAVASALMCHPALLLVDELSLGLAPVVVADLAQRLTGIKREIGLSILLVEQNAAVALEIADFGYVMENGRVVLDGDADRLRGHPDIQEFYLGHTSGARRSYRDVKQYRRSRRWYG
jgi:branched-chain amino acid transport system ATP-binding protein